MQLLGHQAFQQIEMAGRVSEQAVVHARELEIEERLAHGRKLVQSEVILPVYFLLLIQIEDYQAGTGTRRIAQDRAHGGQRA